VVLGLAYPLVMTGIAQAAFHGNANGSLVHSGTIVLRMSGVGRGRPATAVRHARARPSRSCPRCCHQAREGTSSFGTWPKASCRWRRDGMSAA
jgi:K+-transporting ATPase c subunit